MRKKHVSRGLIQMIVCAGPSSIGPEFLSQHVLGNCMVGLKIGLKSLTSYLANSA